MIGQSSPKWTLRSPKLTIWSNRTSVAKNQRDLADMDSPWHRMPGHWPKTMNSCTFRIRCLGDTTCSAWSSFRSMSGDPIFLENVVKKNKLQKVRHFCNLYLRKVSSDLESLSRRFFFKKQVHFFDIFFKEKKPMRRWRFFDVFWISRFAEKFHLCDVDVFFCRHLGLRLYYYCYLTPLHPKMLSGAPGLRKAIETAQTGGSSDLKLDRCFQKYVITSSSRASRGRKFQKKKVVYSKERICL